MRKLNIKPFDLRDFSKISSEFISDVFDTFLNNFLYLFEAFRRLNEKYETNTVVTDKTFDFLFNEISKVSEDNVITAHDEYIASENLDIYRGAGVIGLSGAKESLIPLLDRSVSPEISDIGEEVGQHAISGVRIFKFDWAGFVEDGVTTLISEDPALRRILDDTGITWYEEYGYPNMGLIIKFPEVGPRVSYIDIFPAGGTAVDEIRILGTGNNWEIIDLDDEHDENLNKRYPIRVYVNKTDFRNEIRVKLSGNSGFYSLFYIKAYAVDFVDNGYIEYDISGLEGQKISSITFNDPLIRPDTLERALAVDIEIFKRDGDIDDEPVYSSYSSDTYPIVLDISLDSLVGDEKWVLKLVLNSVEDASPEFRRLTIN